MDGKTSLPYGGQWNAPQYVDEPTPLKSSTPEPIEGAKEYIYNIAFAHPWGEEGYEEWTKKEQEFAEKRQLAQEKFATTQPHQKIPQRSRCCDLCPPDSGWNAPI